MLTIKYALWFCKMISVFILPLNHFKNWDTQREEFTDAQREKEREKERLIDTAARSHRRLRSRLRADRDLAKHRADRDRSIAPHDLAPLRTQSPLSLPSSLNLTGFDDFFLGFVCVSVLRNEWYYIFFWQLRKCEQQVENVFSMVFSRTQSIPKNIFRNIFWNATKHMKTFSFPKNSISGKYSIFWKYFYTNQTQPKCCHYLPSIWCCNLPICLCPIKGSEEI